jgi:4-hydroxy-tetrahydrodipicolinate reductase
VKILLIGYGKMGQIIERLAIERGHEIVGKYDSQNPYSTDTHVKADVAIEFSSPELAVGHINSCFLNQIPVVVGTTGWYKELDQIKQNCAQYNGSLFTATNFSLGVNLFFEMSKQLTKIMNGHNYDCNIREIHHTEKKDAPSGTAITLAENVIKSSSTLNHWELLDNGQGIKGNNSQEALPIYAERLPNVPGTHILSFESSVDCIKLEHEAKNREGFAIGAIVAAEWLIGKTGVFGMSDLLNFEN